VWQQAVHAAADRYPEGTEKGVFAYSLQRLGLWPDEEPQPKK
jgi:hypothetical protein